MPPRTRKTVAPAPAPEGTAADGQAVPEVEAALVESHPLASEVEATAADASSAMHSPTEAVEVAAPAFHWETTQGVPGGPCMLCLPQGPTPAQGTFCCPHGQWVRVLGHA